MSSSEKGWKELETERLVLRMFCDKDVDAYARICANPEVTRFIGGETRPGRRFGAAWPCCSATGHSVDTGCGPWRNAQAES